MFLVPSSTLLSIALFLPSLSQAVLILGFGQLVAHILHHFALVTNQQL